MSVVSIMDVVCFDRALSHVIILKCKDNHTSDKKPATVDVVISVVVREVCRKSKWKFKMAFAMKAGWGVSRGSRVPHTYFEK